MNYHTTTNVYLSLEDYYNQGVTSEEAKEIIESIQDPSSMWKYDLVATPTHLNGNWSFEISSNNHYYINLVITQIENKLIKLINAKNSTDISLIVLNDILYPA